MRRRIFVCRRKEYLYRCVTVVFDFIFGWHSGRLKFSTCVAANGVRDRVNFVFVDDKITAFFSAGDVTNSHIK